MSYSVQFAQKALFVRDGSVLLLRKSDTDPWNPSRWEVPGGRLEQGESIDEHLRREVHEEVGLNVSVGMPLAMWCWRLGESDTAPTVVCVIRLCSSESDVAEAEHHKIDDHIESWKWVSIESVQDYDLIPNARRSILEAVNLSREVLHV